MECVLYLSKIFNLQYNNISININHLSGKKKNLKILKNNLNELSKSELNQEKSGLKFIYT